MSWNVRGGRQRRRRELGGARGGAEAEVVGGRDV